MKHTISIEMLAAYKATQYQVQTPKGIITLKVGEPTPELLFETNNSCQRVVFISACNPYSIATGEDENMKRHQELLQVVTESGYKMYDGKGIDPSGQWPGEISLAVFDATDADIIAWMQKFDQHAVVIAERNSTIELRYQPVNSADRDDLLNKYYSHTTQH